jgi:hypothetical protein
MRIFRVAAAAAAVITAGAPGAVPAFAGPAAVPKPASGTPHLPTSGGYANVQALAGCGGRIYAGGKFARILSHGKTLARSGLFSFSASPPWTVTSWNPGVAGTVDAITFAGSCSQVIVGGAFGKVHGTPAHDIAELSTSTGAVNGSFAHSASATVNTLADWHGHIMAGGAFRSINGSARCCLVSLSPATGRYDGWADISVSGGRHTLAGAQAVSPNGSSDVVSGDFTRINGAARPQAVMLRAGDAHPAVTGWSTPGFARPCDRSFWARGLAWSQDGSTVYVAGTGMRTRPHRLPLTGMCDALSAVPASGGPVRWTDYTGCDSLYSVIEAGGVAFTGGHQRWYNNRHACNKRGPGATPDPGLWGVNASTGALVTSSGRPAYYMSRANADVMLDYAGHVIIGSANRFGSDMCQGVHGLSGLCVLPVP